MEKGIKLRGLHDLTGISKSRLNNIENHIGSPPDIVELEKIAIALDKRITDLFESEYK
jgi:transcriptional regulator with XRE-family HTH domain